MIHLQCRCFPREYEVGVRVAVRTEQADGWAKQECKYNDDNEVQVARKISSLFCIAASAQVLKQFVMDDSRRVPFMPILTRIVLRSACASEWAYIQTTPVRLMDIGKISDVHLRQWLTLLGVPSN